MSSSERPGATNAADAATSDAGASKASTPQIRSGPPPRTRNEMPSNAELTDIGAKSLATGAVSGAIGTVIGAGAGILRGAPPTLFALFAGLQWFSLGSTYMASKGLFSHAWGGERNLSNSDLVKVSGVAGGVSGMVGGMFRGPKNIIPGIIFFSALGGGSEFLSQRLRSDESTPGRKTDFLDSKWSPLKRLSDRDYERMLEEKILKLDAEIAIVNENIASLKASSQQQEGTAAATEAKPAEVKK